MLAGCGITLSLAPFTIWPAAIAALMALYATVNHCAAKNVFRYSFAFASGLLLSGSYWIYISMHDHGGAAPPLALIMTLMFCLFIAVLIPPYMWAYRRFFYHKNALQRSLAFAALWFLSEHLRTWFLTGFPWLYVGYSQTQAALSSWAPIIGTLGISLLLAFSAAALIEIISAVKNKTFKTSTAIITLIISGIWLAPVGLQNIEWTQNKTNKTIKVALVQPNIALDKKWDPRYLYKDMYYHRRVSNEMADRDLILWAETAVSETYHYAESFLQLLDQESKVRDTAIILGIPSQWQKDGQRVFHNTMIGVGEASGIYHKQKLVPFGEYVPFAHQLRGLIQFFDLPLSEFIPGPEDQEYLSAKGLKIMPFVCYEIVYPDFVAKQAGAMDLLVTVSNDAWFGDSIGPLQHLQMVQMRALETGRYILRGTNTGVTAVINHQGEIIAQLPQFKRGILKAEVYAREGLTPVARFGMKPVLAFSVLTLLLLLLRRHFLK